MNKYRKKRIQKKMKRENLDVDITSLLDILVILLVFLLKSYSASDLTVDLADNVKLPHSQSNNIGHDSIVIQVNKNKKLFINNENIGMVNNSQSLQKMTTELKDYRKKEIKELKERNPASLSTIEKESYEKRKKQKKMVNLVFDQSIPYYLMERIMEKASSVGYSKFKFIVMSGEKS